MQISFLRCPPIGIKNSLRVAALNGRDVSLPLSFGICMEEEGTQSYEKREQVILACVACRRAKTKCSAARPCVCCVQRGYSLCIDAPKKKRRKCRYRRKRKKTPKLATCNSANAEIIPHLNAFPPIAEILEDSTQKERKSEKQIDLFYLESNSTLMIDNRTQLCNLEMLFRSDDTENLFQTLRQEYAL